MRTLVVLLVVLYLSFSGLNGEAAEDKAVFLEEFPHLKQHLFSEPDTHLRLGVGVSPVQIMKNQEGLSANLLEIHWTKDWLDWELFTVSYGRTLSSEPTSQINAFTFRTIPKYRVSKVLSIGPLVGFQLISFPNVTAKLKKTMLDHSTPSSPEFEPLSVRGVIFGAAASETFDFGTHYVLKVSQIVYKQDYDPTGTKNGWTYYFSDDALNSSTDLISPGMVFLFEVSVLY